jgi:lipopolysaccharide transport system permease protein
MSDNVRTMGVPTAERTGDAARPPSGPTTRVEPASGWRPLDVQDLWRHRELLYFLTWRDVKVRYKQTAFGAAWAVLQPLLTTFVFAFVFGRLANVPSDGLPYPLFALAGLVPWMFFSNTVTLGSNSIVQTPDLVTKIYFPRVLMPTASVLGGLLDMAIASVLLIVVALFYGVVPGPEAIAVVPLVALGVIAAVGVTVALSALNVEYRDVRYAVPFLVQLWLFATPVAYPSSLVEEPWRTLMGLNPMAGVVEGFRWALLGTDTAPGGLVLVSAASALVIVTASLVYFRRVEDRFADVI